MKLKATIKAEVDITENDDLTGAQEKVMRVLIEIAHDWVNGECSPVIEFSFEHEGDTAKELDLLN